MNYLCGYASAEIEIKKSRFLAEAFPVSSQEEARKILKEQKAKYSTASHVVHAFVIGKNASILGCSDDGEPSGTAGRPLLEVLKGTGITNWILTVTRWFGGTLLGTGGLVKAYTEAAKTVLLQLECAELVPVVDFTIKTDYKTHERIIRELEQFKTIVLTEDFDTAVTMHCRVQEEFFEPLRAAVLECSAGTARFCGL